MAVQELGKATAALAAVIFAVTLGFGAAVAVASGQAEDLLGTWEGNYVYPANKFEGQSTLEVFSVEEDTAEIAIEWRWGEGNSDKREYEAKLQRDSSGAITGLIPWPDGGVLALDGSTLIGDLELIPGLATHIYNKQ